MPPAPRPRDETERLASLRALGILDTPPEERFDALVREAKRALDVPTALISLVDDDRQWFKARVGMSVAQTPREQSFCAHAILGDGPLIVADAARDARFRDNPLVAGERGVRFYAGVPLSAPDGRKVGTLCVLDRVPRALGQAQVALLLELARRAERELTAAAAQTPLLDAGARRLLEELRRSPKRKAQRLRTFAGFALAALALAGAAAIPAATIRRQRADAARVDHTYLVLETLYRLRAEMLAAGDAARAYARAGTAAQGDLYALARSACLESAARAQWLTTDNPERQLQVARLRRALEVRLTHADALMRLPPASAAASAAALEDQRRDWGADEIVRDAIGGEKALLARRREREDASARRLAASSGAAGAFALAFFAWALYSLDRDLDARLAAQASVQAQSARLAAILDGMEDGVIVVDAEGRHILHNPAAERILGLSLLREEPSLWSERCRYTDADGIAPLPQAQRPLMAALAGTSSRDIEFMMRYPEHPEGIVIQASSAPVRALDSSVLGAVTVFHDATASRRSARLRSIQLEVARALAQAGDEDPLPAVLEKLCRGLGWVCAEAWETEESGVIRRSRAWSQDKSAEVSAFLAAAADERLAPGKGPAGRACAARAPLWIADASTDAGFARAGAAARAGLRAALCVPLVHAERPYGAICVFGPVVQAPEQDILDLAESLAGQIGLSLARRRAQADAARAAAERRAVFDAATEVAIITTDVDGTIRLFNAGAERMLGYAASELSGLRPVGMLFERAEISARLRELAREHGGPRRVPRAAVFAGRALLGGGVEQREWTFVRRDGKRVPVQLIVNVIRDADGLAAGFLGIATDITERRRVQQELARARDLALEAAQAKSDFLANMSHEIRTPMNAIIGMTDLLIGTNLDERQREFARTARAAGEALLGVINDVLDFSKLEAGRLSVESIPFDPRELVREAAALVSAAASAKGLRLSVSVPEDAPSPLLGDPHRLRQVLLNFLSNAVKFTEKGSIVASLTKLESADERTRLRLSVSDQGPGIPPETLRTLFRPFTQADASTTRRYGGTGLGLAISKQLVERMGGQVGVDSEPGRGSTFWCEIPFVLASASTRPAREPASAAPERAAGDPSAPPRAQALTRRRVRVLVVDDNPVNRRLASLQLESLGYACEALPDAAAALARLDAGPAEIIFLDCQMPGMDGYTAAREMRSREAASGRPRAAIIAMTAHALAGDREKCLSAGMDDYVAKPVRLEDLSRALTRWDPALDAAALAELKASAGAQLPSLVGVFVEHSRKIVGELDAALARADLQAAARLMHGLRGSAGSFGAVGVARLATLIEDAAKNGDCAEARAAAEELSPELERAARALSEA